MHRRLWGESKTSHRWLGFSPCRRRTWPLIRRRRRLILTLLSLEYISIHSYWTFAPLYTTYLIAWRRAIALDPLLILTLLGKGCTQWSLLSGLQWLLHTIRLPIGTVLRGTWLRNLVTNSTSLLGQGHYTRLSTGQRFINIHIQ